MLKDYVSKIADDIVKGQLHDPYHLLFLIDVACEFFYEHRYDCYEILHPALVALEKFLMQRIRIIKKYRLVKEVNNNGLVS